jgi:hypothetical protein
MEKIKHAQLLAEQRFASGWRPKALLVGGNSKLEKTARTIGLSLAPANSSGYEVCASRSDECTKFCLFTSGLGMPELHSPDLPCNPVWVGRIIKTLWFFREREDFMIRLYRTLPTTAMPISV